MPESDASTVLSESEILILKKRANYEVGKPLPISQALLWIARLGGHLNRKNDGNPGLETIWKGMSRLHDLEEGFLLAL